MINDFIFRFKYLGCLTLYSILEAIIIEPGALEASIMYKTVTIATPCIFILSESDNNIVARESGMTE